MQHGTLPEGLEFQRATDEFTATSVPEGLRRAHRVAPGVWGLLKLHAGTLRFVWEDDPDAPVELAAGDSVVIEPDRRHHVEPGDDARFQIEFHR
ncbi:MAG: DUF1971 domain-containing protein [Actinobacteria bacterium]|nr:DUF1971 domain-containing protein [Actinomycetota bacterium]